MCTVRVCIVWYVCVLNGTCVYCMVRVCIVRYVVCVIQYVCVLYVCCMQVRYAALLGVVVAIIALKISELFEFVNIDPFFQISF